MVFFAIFTFASNVQYEFEKYQNTQQTPKKSANNNNKYTTIIISIIGGSDGKPEVQKLCKQKPTIAPHL